MAELNAPVRPAAYVEDRTEWRLHAGVVSWGAVLAGAVAAAAFGLILLTLGTGLGLAALSPWHSARDSATTFGVAAIIWVCVTQILTSGLGGYLAGRLRHRWPAVEVDEVYFRDTAHGFLTWAVATLATAALFAAMLPALGRVGAQAAAKVVPAAFSVDRGDANAAVNQWPVGYYVDSLLRLPGSPATAQPLLGAPSAPDAAATAASSANTASSATAASAPAPIAASNAISGASTPAAAASPPNAIANTAGGAVVSPVVTPAVAATQAVEPGASMSAPAGAGAPPKAEVTRIFLNSLATGDALSSADTDYVAMLVARYTGLAPQAAQARVGATYTQLQQKVAALRDEAKVAADHARHASASASLWLFVSLLMGAFAASFMAVYGGRLRDV